MPLIEKETVSDGELQSPFLMKIGWGGEELWIQEEIRQFLMQDFRSLKPEWSAYFVLLYPCYKQDSVCFHVADESF